MTFKQYLEEKGFWSKALLGASLLAGSGHAADKFELPDPPKMFVDYNKQQHSQAELDILAATLILEAGAEQDARSMEAIFNILQNRAKKNDSSEFEEAIKPYQFSCWNKSTRESRQKTAEKIKNHSRWDTAIEIVKKGLNGKLEDVTKGATHYHVYKGHRKVTPKWSNPKFGGKNSNALLTATIGNHAFFKNADKIVKK